MVISQTPFILFFHRKQELSVRGGFLQARGEEIHRINRGEIGEALAKEIDLLELSGVIEEFLFSGYRS